MSEKAAEAIAFIDANMCLEFPSGDQSKWVTMTNAKRVRVVVCMGVLVEVEDKKNKPRIGERARWWFAKVNEARKAKGRIELHPTATLEFYMSSTFRSPAEARGDEAIRKQAVEFRDKPENKGVPLYFISDDGGARLFAEEAEGLETVVPTDFIKKCKDEPTPEEAELAELRRENQVLKNRMPKIEVVVSCGAEYVLNKGTLAFKLKKPTPGRFQAQVDKRLEEGQPIHWDTSLMRASADKRQRASEWAANQEAVEDESARTLSFRIKVRNMGGETSARSELKVTYDVSPIQATTCAPQIKGDRTIPERWPGNITPLHRLFDMTTGIKTETPLWTIEPATCVPTNLQLHRDSTQPRKFPEVGLGSVIFRVDDLGHGGGESNEHEVTLTFKSWGDIRPIALVVALRSESPPFADPPLGSSKQNVISLLPSVE